jgi:NADH dehydrogenase [ubiquinone] 1 alpha subcomplex assembly factor 7
VTLARRIADRIRESGPITVAAYMEAALQDPAEGYYRQGDPLGRAGDFVTAPEISQMFGEMLGLWCAEGWLAAGSPDPLAGRARSAAAPWMADALRATARVPGFPRRHAPAPRRVEPRPARRQAAC